MRLKILAILVPHSERDACRFGLSRMNAQSVIDFRVHVVFPRFWCKLSQNLLHRQRRNVQHRKERYDNGLLKLADTEEQVAQMQIDLEELQPKLKDATIATDALLVQIAKDTEVANEKKAIVEKEASARRVFSWAIMVKVKTSLAAGGLNEYSKGTPQMRRRSYAMHKRRNRRR